MKTQLQDKVAIVTGGGTGIGEAISSPSCRRTNEGRALPFSILRTRTLAESTRAARTELFCDPNESKRRR